MANASTLMVFHEVSLRLAKTNINNCPNIAQSSAMCEKGVAVVGGCSFNKLLETCKEKTLEFCDK